MKNYTKKGARRMQAAFIAAAALTLGACTSTKLVNRDVYDSASDLTTRVSQFQIGMDKQDVISILGHDITDRWTKLNNSEINEVKCGCEPNAGSYADMQKMADELRASEGYSFNFSEIKKNWVYTGLHTKTTHQGEDITLRIVFTNDKLVAWDQGGGPVNKKDKDFILKGIEDVVKFAM